MDVVHLTTVLPVIDVVRTRLDLRGAVPMSALTGDGLADLKAEIATNLPEGPLIIRETTGPTSRSASSPVLREKIFHLTEQEIPYATYVDIEKFDESE